MEEKEDLDLLISLKKVLENDLIRCETMSDRIPVREELRGVEKRIRELTTEKLV